MNLSHLYYFRKLAEVQHYTHAAEQLFITQPTLSNAVSQLEKELGIALFEREGRNVRLTKQGKEFNEYVTQALNLIDKGVDIAHEHAGSLSASFDLGVVYTIQADYLPSLMRAFQLKYGQNTRISINQGLSGPLIEDIQCGRYDVVFCAKGKDIAGLDFVPVFKQRLVAVVHGYSPFANCEEVTIDDLSHAKVITYTPGTILGDEVDALLKPHIEAGLDIYGTCDDEITLGSMVDSDPSAVGITLETLGLLPFTGLKTVPLKEAPGGFHPVYMVYRKNVFQSRAVENFINFVKEFKFSETRFMVPIDDEAVEEKQDEEGAEE